MDTSLTPEQLAAELYDLSVPDWPGELDFYRRLAHQAGPVLEVACGTGRVTIPLFDEGIEITGSDLDATSLEIARRKRPGLRWVEVDMRLLDLHQAFAMIIIPGHSFQAMLTPQDQLSALAAFRRHLLPGGTLVIHLDHQDVRWLAEVSGSRAGVFETRKTIGIPSTGERIRPVHAWTFEPATQTATVTSKWEQLGEDDAVLHTWTRRPMPLHCVFRFEMEHLLARAGFEVRALYGDFFENELTASSTDMIWVAQKPESA